MFLDQVIFELGQVLDERSAQKKWVSLSYEIRTIQASPILERAFSYLHAMPAIGG